MRRFLFALLLPASPSLADSYTHLSRKEAAAMASRDYPLLTEDIKWYVAAHEPSKDNEKMLKE